MTTLLMTYNHWQQALDWCFDQQTLADLQIPKHDVVSSGGVSSCEQTCRCLLGQGVC
jgi:hypothetical protein